MLMLLGFFLAVAATGAHGGPLFTDGQYDVPNDTAQCTSDLVDWCRGMKYTDSGFSIFSVSVTFMEPEGMCQYFCSSDNNSTNCTKNGSPLFGCNRGGRFTYKGGDVAGADVGDICSAADRAFNDLYVQNFSYDNSTLEDVGSLLQQNMERMMNMWSYVQEQIAQLNRFFVNPFAVGFPFNDYNNAAPAAKDSAEEKNSIERET